MNRRHRLTVLAVLLLPVAALTLRWDLAHLATRQGVDHLAAGRPAAALAAFDRAAALGMDAAALAYNAGVHFYRSGRLEEARRQFSAALATAGPSLALALHYNRGNTLVRMSEQRAAKEPEAARRLLAEAIADYDRALAGAPGAADVLANRSLARGRLAALVAAPADAGKSGQPATRPPPTAQADGASQGRPGADPKTAKGAAQRPADRADAGRRAEDTQADQGRRSTQRQLGREEAERLLSEARGRDRPAGLPLTRDQPGRWPPAAKDW